MGNEASSIAKHIKQRGKTILRIRLAMSPVLSSTWAKLVPKWVRFRAKLRHVGAKLGRNWNQAGPSWQLGALLAETTHVAAMSDRNGAFGQCWANVGQISKCANFTTKPSSHPLLHYHAWAPSVQVDLLTIHARRDTTRNIRACIYR